MLYIATAILLLAAAGLIIASRRRIRANAACANAVVSVTITNVTDTGEHPLRTRERRRELIDQHNDLYRDYRRLQTRYELMKNKTSPEAQARCRRLHEQSGPLNTLREQMRQEFPDIRFTMSEAK